MFPMTWEGRAVNVRTILGIIVGLGMAGLVFYFSWDVIRLLGGIPSRASVLTTLSLVVVAIIGSVEAGYYVATGHWLEDRTASKERILVVFGVAVAVFVLSIVVADGGQDY